MLNNRRNFMLLIRIRTASRIRIVFPVLLPVLEETMEELADWMIMWKWICRSSSGWATAVSGLLQLGLETIREIRSLGRFQLLRIEAEQTRVSVDLR